ncbi:MAG: hypothetical protein PVH77_07890 [Phycisphaerales bacterium]|jgi:hypothetical protein
MKVFQRTALIVGIATFCYFTQLADSNRLYFPAQFSDNFEQSGVYVRTRTAEGWSGQSNISTNPSFVQIGHWLDTNDPNNEWMPGNYHLTEEFPCIDAGNPAGSVGLEPVPNSGTHKASTKREYLRFLWQTPALLRTPESVIYDEQRNVLYVSNYNVKGGFTQSGDRSPDEFISKVSLTGEIVKLRWVTGLVSPTGITIYQDKLYVVERDYLTEIDIETAKIVNRYSIKVACFPNDIIFDSNGTGYISDNDKNAKITIYRFVNGQIKPWLNSSQLKRPNGLCWDRDRLVAYDYGSTYLKGVRPSDENIINIANLNNITLRICDGLKVVDEDTYLISDWYGIVYLADKADYIKQILDLRNTTTVAGSSVNSADIEYIPRQKLLIIPTFNDHRLIAYELLD